MSSLFSALPTSPLELYTLLVIAFTLSTTFKPADTDARTCRAHNTTQCVCETRMRGWAGDAQRQGKVHGDALHE